MNSGVWDGVLDIGTDGYVVGVTVGVDDGCGGRDGALLDSSDLCDEVSLESSSIR